MNNYSVRIMEIDENNIKSLLMTLSKNNRIKIEGYRNKKDKIRTLIGEILIRTIII